MHTHFCVVYLGIVLSRTTIDLTTAVPSLDSKVIHPMNDNNNNQIIQPRSDVNWKQEAKMVLDVEAELDETIYLTFDEKERHDGFKRTVPEDFPYAVVVYVQSYSGPGAGACSGSLLTSSWVLTAAHCFNSDVQMVIVYAGGNSLKELVSNTRPTFSQFREAKSFYQHPNYTPAVKVMYDIGLVKVTKAFKMTSTVNIVQLTKVPWTHDQFKGCMFTGFGRVFYKKNDTDDNTRKTHYFEVKNSCPCESKSPASAVMMCSTPRDDYGICQGDSGGGLVCDGKVVAVACSVGFLADVDSCNMTIPKDPDCGVKNTLSVFLKSDPYLTWINERVNKGTNNRSCNLVGIIGPVLLYIVYQNIP